MPLAIRSALCGFLVANVTAICTAQMHGGGHHGGSHSSGMMHYIYPSRGQGSHNVYSPQGFLGATSGGYFGLAPYSIGSPAIAFPMVGFPFNNFPPIMPEGQEGPGGLMLSQPVAIRSSSVPTTTQRRANASRADELVEVGDRSFRGGNYRRAEERYHLAIKANNETPWPHVRLAQIALVRGNYNKAASHLRDAVATTTGVGWLLEAPDIQSIFAEPGDFAKQIAHLESYLQIHPTDRNAWFVLGAENYFSGHTRTASDAFLRLTDRSPDEALTAFLDASTVANRSTETSSSAN